MNKLFIERVSGHQQQQQQQGMSVKVCVVSVSQNEAMPEEVLVCVDGAGGNC